MTVIETKELIEAFDEPVIFVDAERRITALNGAASEFFGEIPLGSDLTRAFRNPAALRYVDGVMSGENANEVIRGIEFQSTRTVTTDFRLTVTKVTAANLGKTQFAIVLKDISHILEAEQMRSDFVANVSHELRSPLTAISGFIETLAGPASEDPNASKRFLGIMGQEATRMNRIIDDLLSLSKVESDARVRPTSTADLKALLARVIATLEPQANEQNKTIVCECPQDACLVNADEDQTVQVIQNLLDNAIKYSAADSEIKVLVASHGFISPMRDKAISFSIRDTGDGISPEHIPRLTERFYRVDSGRSRQKGGTGLGLAIVKHIVNRHRGKFTIESEHGKGSVFTVFLPVAKER